MSITAFPVSDNTFNRTIVELKLGIGDGTVLQQLAFNRTIVELKLKRKVSQLVKDAPFNRTIVELKFLPAMSSAVLIFF